jgi:hypothetical protein
MRLRTVLFTLAMSSFAAAQTPSMNLFTSDERDAVLRYWSDPTRYVSTVPTDAMEKGLWQVRLTTEGSTWLWALNKGKKNLGPPLPDAPAASDEQKAADAWVTARIARDRWIAWQAAVRNNQRVLGKALPAVDKDTPAVEPPDPGPLPALLAGTVGNPPPFAAAVVPMQHEVRFDDGTLVYQDNIRTGSQRYAYYRYSQGVISFGTAVKTLPQDKLDHLFHLANISDAEARVMRSVSMLEGGFDSINTYDTGYVSVGFIQFACLKDGAGSLGAMLRDYKTTNPDQFQKDFRDFGIDVTPSGALGVLDLVTGAEVYGPDAAKKIIDDKRLIAVFQHAGQRSEPYVAAQIRAAKDLYYPGDDTFSITIDGQTYTGKVSDVIKSEAGLATLMDRKVNTGTIALLTQVATDIAAEVKPKSLAELAKYEWEIVQRMRYRRDYLADASLSQPQASARTGSQTSRGGQPRGGRKGGGKGLKI